MDNVRDAITVTGLKATGFHGVFEHEKRDGQEFTIDVTLYTDIRPAAETDDLALTLNYGELAEVVIREIQSGPYDLIETLAERTAAAIFSHYDDAARLVALDLTVHKPQAPITVPFRDVTITIHRERP